ncbi:outer membrane protein [Rhizobium sp. PAMB 3182]
MRTVLITLLTSTALIAGIAQAQAADAIEAPPAPPPVANDVVPVTPTWQGFYLGGEGDYNWARFGDSSSLNGDGFGGGFYGGYNWQAGKMVYGLEGDIGYSGVEGDVASGFKGKTGWNGAIKGRVGYDLNPFLIYGTGGLAMADTKISGNGDSDSKVQYGATVGVGAEAFVTNNITARVEYDYTNYFDRDYDVGGSSFSRGFDEHSVKVGIGVKF